MTAGPFKRRRISSGSLTDTVEEWCTRTGDSPATVFRKMKAGRLRYIQNEKKAPRRIPHSEYVRHGYVQSLDDL